MTSAQKMTLWLSALGGAGLALVLWGLLVWLDGWPGPIPDAGERIGLALKLAVLPLYLAVGMVIKADESPWLTVLPVAFVLARIAFWVGYRISPMGRAPGMAAGFFINLGMLGFVIARFLG